MWLLHGHGTKFRSASPERREALAGPGVSVGSLLRTALHMLEHGESSQPTVIVSKGSPSGASEEHADVVFLAVDDTTGGPITRSSGPQYVAARGEWLDA